MPLWIVFTVISGLQDTSLYKLQSLKLTSEKKNSTDKVLPIMSASFSWPEHCAQYHLPEMNSMGRVSNIIAGDLCHQPNYCLLGDLVNKMIEIKDTAIFCFLSFVPVSVCILFSVS